MKKLISMIVVLTILFLFAFSYINQGLIHSIIHSDLESIRSTLESFGNFALVAYFIFVIIEVVIAPIPSIILYSLGGILFGGFLASIITFLGNVVGAILAFYIARFFLQKPFEKQVSKKLKQKFDSMTEKYGTLAIFLLRLNPLTSTDIISYLAGLTTMNIWKFVIATGLGLLPMIAVQAYFGAEVIASSPVLTQVFFGISVIYIIIVVFLAIKSKNVSP